MPDLLGRTDEFLTSLIQPYLARSHLSWHEHSPFSLPTSHNNPPAQRTNLSPINYWGEVLIITLSFSPRSHLLYTEPRDASSLVQVHGGTEKRSPFPFVIACYSGTIASTFSPYSSLIGILI